MSVTLVPVERMHKNKNGNESYVEACLITFQKQGNIFHREIITFIITAEALELLATTFAKPHLNCYLNFEKKSSRKRPRPFLSESEE